MIWSISDIDSILSYSHCMLRDENLKLIYGMGILEE
jgi:hypothetical protein